jgi:hypothetical protein
MKRLQTFLLFSLVVLTTIAAFTPFPGASPTGTLGAKGDFLSHNGSNDVVVGIGLDGQIPIADASEANGWRWGGIASGSKLNLLEFPSFEAGKISEGTCTNCTASEETSIILNTPNNESSLKVVGSAAGNYTITKTTGSEFADIQYSNGGFMLD